MARLTTVLSLGPITGHWHVMCLGRKIKCPDRDPAQSRKFGEEFEFQVVVADPGRQRKQKKRLERIGRESGWCAKFAVELFNTF